MSTLTDLAPRPGASQTRNSRGTWALLAVSLATFMTYLDNNIINVAIPTIERQLHLSQSGIEWVVSAYILVFAALLLAGGRLGDVLGLRRVFLGGLALFTVSSLLAGISGDLAMLIASRALQGLGAALLTPATLAIISISFPEPSVQARAVAAWSAVGALALALGPLLGGYLSQDVSWHWIFFINVPVGIATLGLALWAIPTAQRHRRPLDLPGVLASTLALGGLTYGLIEGPQIGWSTYKVLAAFGLALAAALAFVVAERRDTDPMIDLTLFANRVFSGGLAALTLWAFGLFGIYFYTSLYLQDILGFGAIKAGLAFVPMALLIAVGAAVSDRVAARIGAYRSVGIAMALMATGIASITLLGAQSHFLDLMPGFAIIGMGGGLTIPLTATVLGVMPSERAGVASAVFNASREMGGLLGITVIGVILTSRLHAESHSGQSFPSAFLSGFHLSLLAAGAMVAMGGATAWMALRSAAVTPQPLPAPPAEPVGA